MSDQEAKAKSTEEALSVEDFIGWVEDMMADVESVDRSANMHWCSQWWAHPEAIKRLKALYEEWLARQAEGGMSSWWTDHFDRHAAVLFAKRGPFGECGVSHVERGMRRTLDCEQPPAGWSW